MAGCGSTEGLRAWSGCPEELGLIMSEYSLSVCRDGAFVHHLVRGLSPGDVVMSRPAWVLHLRLWPNNEYSPYTVPGITDVIRGGDSQRRVP